MTFAPVFDRFIKKSPISVMLRGTLENVFAADKMNALFRENAVRQVDGKLAFSTCADLMALVVTTIRPSVNAAYVAESERFSVSVQSVYNKLSGIEPEVSEALVRQTADDLREVLAALAAPAAGPLPGFDVRLVDGNHLAGTEHRLLELRGLGAAALPGHTIVILNPHTQLLEDVLVCEDGHANQRTMFDRLLEKVVRKQCWIADSHYCTKKMLFGVSRRGAYFLVRQHRSLSGELLGKRRKLGRVSTGVLYEQTLKISAGDEELTVRRLTIVRDQPTAQGETEVHLLTNLPPKVSGKKAAEAYLDRWSIETAFGKLATTLRSEINTLGYPDAALFGFCVSVVLYNAMRVVLAALEAAHPLPTVEEDDPNVVKSPRYSQHYLWDELSGVWRGMEIAIEQAEWTAAFAGLTPKQLANKLRWLANRVDARKYHTNRYRKQKTKRKKTISGNRGNHVSTQKEINNRKRVSLKLLQ
ncbi:MAG: transposase [Pirellulaceae bacterium]|nr:transposase [Planctomycetales bacterium]